MLLENGWFKKEKEKESLQEIINTSTADRTKEIEDHYEGQYQAIELLRENDFRLDTLDEKMHDTSSESLEKTEDSFLYIKDAFEETIIHTTTELMLYAVVNPSFQPTLEDYQEVSNNLLETLETITFSENMPDDLVQKWQDNKKEYLILSEKIRVELVDTLGEMHSRPPVYN
jgi:hypothetical protein